MTTAEIEKTPEVLGPARNLEDLTLEELAEVANREVTLGERAARQLIEHWIAAGEALLAARQKVLAAGDGWLEWLDTKWEASGPELAFVMMRMATYQDELRAAPEVTSKAKALRALKGLPPIFSSSSRGVRYGPEAKQLARKMQAEGKGWTDIGNAIGCAPATAQSWLDAEFHHRQREAVARRGRERREQRREKLEKQRLAAARKHGGTVSHAYEAVLKLAAELDKAMGEMPPSDARGDLGSALAACYRAKDLILRVIGTR